MGMKQTSKLLVTTSENFIWWHREKVYCWPNLVELPFVEYMPTISKLLPVYLWIFIYLVKHVVDFHVEKHDVDSNGVQLEPVA